MSLINISILKPKRIRGQGMTEYIIIVALIAVAAIGVFRFYGNTARSQVAVAASELGGQNSATSRASAKRMLTLLEQKEMLIKTFQHSSKGHDNQYFSNYIFI